MIVIKGSEEKKNDILTLNTGRVGVDIEMNGRTIALFDHDGQFVFWGHSTIPRYKGRWDE